MLALSIRQPDAAAGQRIGERCYMYYGSQARHRCHWSKSRREWELPPRNAVRAAVYEITQNRIVRCESLQGKTARAAVAPIRSADEWIV